MTPLRSYSREDCFSRRGTLPAPIDGSPKRCVNLPRYVLIQSSRRSSSIFENSRVLCVTRITSKT
jgi:hypothetical protein